MRSASTGFVITQGSVKNDILVPKYYDPGIESDLQLLSESHDIVSIGELIESGELEMRQGNYIPKMHYGTGSVPYIRTSDIANWELRGSPKHGISDAVAEVFWRKQDLQADDILLVHEGTYLIGTGCLITEFDTKALFQHHLARLRVLESDRITGPLLMTALMSDIVMRQIRSKQFTADVIDSIVGRFPEVRIPLPRSIAARQRQTSQARTLFRRRSANRLKLAILRRGLDEALVSGDFSALSESVNNAEGSESASGITGFLGSAYRAASFQIREADVQNDILLPRYYDPTVEEMLHQLEGSNDLRSVGDLVASGELTLNTGVEVGKLAYGTGDVPFVRTSDLGNWELKHDPKQRVSTPVFEKFSVVAPAENADILLVRDGTYLVGSSAMVADEDLPMLYSGGVLRLHVNDRERLDPFLLLALLNTVVAGRQMRNKQFTRDVIDTLGRRIEEVVLPFPKASETKRAVAELMKQLVEDRARDRRLMGSLGSKLLSG